MKGGVNGAALGRRGAVRAPAVRGFRIVCDDAHTLRCVLEVSFQEFSDHFQSDGAVSVCPAWEVREHGDVTTWFAVRLDLPDGGWIDVLAVASGGCVGIEEVRSQPPLTFDDLAAVVDWIEEPLLEACGMAPEREDEPGGTSACRDRPAMPRGVEGLRFVAEEYLAARREGVDPVCAVMRATGRSRRRSLKLIAGARDAGFLPPRHVRC
ncbi:DUF6214 family protein [Streptomyces sp. NPDC093228]|jgi:hypothetical protein|uniref:DUF6214 family protein n=1 Tax=Streptomyces sp. NPDC093228 TaxID=3155070 RepID=UPI000E369E71|nr:hypothetical protein BX257_7722 [Streptomyces sp. 3212.3]